MYVHVGDMHRVLPSNLMIITMTNITEHLFCAIYSAETFMFISSFNPVRK